MPGYAPASWRGRRAAGGLANVDPQGIVGVAAAERTIRGRCLPTRGDRVTAVAFTPTACLFFSSNSKQWRTVRAKNRNLVRPVSRRYLSRWGSLRGATEFLPRNWFDRQFAFGMGF